MDRDAGNLCLPGAALPGHSHRRGLYPAPERASERPSAHAVAAPPVAPGCITYRRHDSVVSPDYRSDPKHALNLTSMTTGVD